MVMRSGVRQGEGSGSYALNSEQVTQEIVLDCLIAVLDKF